MAGHAVIRFKDHTPPDNVVYFSLELNPKEKYKGVKPENIVSIELDSDELKYAQETLGAAKVNKKVVHYFGDEAARIWFNW